jgi:hypothetical protein
MNRRGWLRRAPLLPLALPAAAAVMEAPPAVELVSAGQVVSGSTLGEVARTQAIVDAMQMGMMDLETAKRLMGLVD